MGELDIKFLKIYLSFKYIIYNLDFIYIFEFDIL